MKVVLGTMDSIAAGLLDFVDKMTQVKVKGEADGRTITSSQSSSHPRAVNIENNNIHNNIYNAP